jgi:hypothetical protein
MCSDNGSLRSVPRMENVSDQLERAATKLNESCSQLTKNAKRAPDENMAAALVCGARCYMYSATMLQNVHRANEQTAAVDVATTVSVTFVFAWLTPTMKVLLNRVREMTPGIEQVCVRGTKPNVAVIDCDRS